MLDPFGGVGITGLACSFVGIPSVLIELESHFVTWAEESFRLHDRTWERLGLPRPVIIQGDSRRLMEVLKEQVSCIVTSPPYAEIRMDGGGWFGKERKGWMRPYSEGPANAWRTTRDQANLGNLPERFYWSSLAEIYYQCFTLLPNHGHMVLVLKSYVKKGKLVDLPGQTAELLEAVGFRVIHWHEAMLIARESQLTLAGGEIRKQRKSFFRRLYEKKHPGLSVDNEVVLCAQKSP